MKQIDLKAQKAIAQMVSVQERVEQEDEQESDPEPKANPKRRERGGYELIYKHHFYTHLEQNNEKTDPENEPSPFK